MIRILLTEDNKEIAEGLSYALTKEGYETDVCMSAREAYAHTAERGYDLAILDIMLEERDGGLLLCRTLKEERPDCGVIFLTAKDEEQMIVKGLDLGADDYIVKPFRTRELLSRIRAVLRRYNKGEQRLICGALTADLKGHLVLYEGKEIPMTALEYRILVLLLRNRGQTMTREQILDEIWDFSGEIVNDNTLTVYIRRIRAKLPEEIIETVRGVGYRIRG